MRQYTPLENTKDYKIIKQHRSTYHASSLDTFTAYDTPVAIERGFMQHVWDTQGVRYIDCTGQNGSIIVGHGHPFVIEEAKKQIDKIPHVSTTYYNSVPVDYSKELIATLPPCPDSTDGKPDQWVVHLVNSGSEAIDLAMLLARLYTKNFDLIAMRNSFHGLHFGAMSLTGIAQCRHALPSNPGILHVDNPDMYRGAYGNTTQAYVECVERTIATATCGTLAGMFFEPVQGFNGVIPMPDGYLSQVTDIIRKVGGLCIIDEVQTGFGRLGTHFWGFEAHDVIPDIMVIAKGMGNGFPIAGVVTRRTIANSMRHKKFFNTYGSNPVSSAAARAVLRVLTEDNMRKHAQQCGDIFISGLRTLQKQFPSCIGDVRGSGFMIGIEFVRDPDTKEPAPHIAHALVEFAKNHGILLGKGGALGNVLRIHPPLCLPKKDVEYILKIITTFFSENEHID